MRRFVSTFLLAGLLLLVACPATAWQFLTNEAGTTAVKVPLLPVAALTKGGGEATSVQIKNTGTGTLTVSLHRYTGTVWKQTHPLSATLETDIYYGVCDSVITLGPSEFFWIKDVAPTRGAHVLYVTRPSATSFKVAYE